MSDKLNYIQGVIDKINAPNFDFEKNGNGNSIFGSLTNMKNFMSEEFYKFISVDAQRSLLLKELELISYVKSKIVEIANRHFFLKGDLEKFYNSEIQKEVIENIKTDDYINNVLGFIEKQTKTNPKYKFVRKHLTSIIAKQQHFLATNGFPTNLLQINTGVMTANAGDSAQFLFLARAILAGYNCSNVDVRSSRYDAVIDFDGVLLRIQIKGVSGANISFKDRARGGQGIDHKHDRNLGKRITSKDSDIYVAVDKAVGLCYLIPMKSEIDPRDPSDIKAINLNEFEKFKENWDVIRQVALSKKI